MSEKFQTKGKGPVSLWDMMQKMSGEWKKQEARIQRKRAMLEGAGVDPDLSHIKKPDELIRYEKDPENMSMWDTMKSMEEGFSKIKEYLDGLEAVYDEALAGLKVE